MITILTFDGSWTGLLSCIFEIYDQKIGETRIFTEENIQSDLFGRNSRVISNEINAKRVWTGLAKKVSARTLNHLYAAHLSELPDIANTICSFIRMAFDRVESPECDYSNATVLRISQVDRMVHREKHRMEAFVRFQLTKDGLYYANVEPDFNVLPLIARHFKRRYSDQRWLIYDLKRSYGIYYDLKTVSEVIFKECPTEKSAESIFHEDEPLYQHLWRDYFDHVNIRERKNSKLHLMHVPKRYWKHLTEKSAL